MASSSKPASQQGLFGNLPAELQLDIFDLLDYGSAIFLSATNQFWRARIHPLSLVSDEEKLEFLKRAERFTQHRRHPKENQGYVCAECFQIKKRAHFSEGNLSGKLSLPSPDNSDLYIPRRFCTDCGQRPKIFSHEPHARLIDHGSQWWLCSVCPDGSLGLAQAELLRHFGCAVCRLCVHFLERPSSWAAPAPPQPACPRCKNGLVGAIRSNQRLECHREEIPWVV
ncbi:hypothetical protein HDK77DRAFT_425097 [Phyllosticta capitalensis]|uniref:F-box domain-containing protein n=1 Tax=Phyllosticta capitalensis TaxID=121624 RepID=A0ABR1YSE3_9PEZI